MTHELGAELTSRVDRTGVLEQVRVGRRSLAVNRRAANTGSARALLLLHGWPGWHADWSEVLELLAADSRWSEVELVCPDLFGFGASSGPADPASASEYSAYSPRVHVADLQALLDHYAVSEAIVGGYDLGANLAQALARASGERVSGLVLCDPVHPAARAEAGRVNLSAELWYQALHLLPWASELIAHDRQTVETYLRHFYTHWWGEGHVPEAHFQELVDLYARPGAFEASIGWYRSRSRSSDGRVQEAGVTEPLRVPVEVLWGERDPVTPPVFAESLPRSFESFHLTRLATVGHFGPLEAPGAVAEAFVRLAGRLGW